MAKSYFAILGVTSSASPDEIRSAYRRLAKEFHPDRFQGDSGPFREIQEAYTVLGNDQRRREYERSIDSIPIRRFARTIGRPAPAPLIPEQGPVDIGRSRRSDLSKPSDRPLTKSLNGYGIIFPALNGLNPDGFRT
jgi:curved DNA-binding protein CbpA